MKRLTCTLVAVVGCTQPAETSAPSFDELVAAADRIDAAATKLESAAASLEATAKALEATRAELAARPPDPPPPPPPSIPESREIPGASEAIVCPSEHKCTIKRGFIETAVTETSLVRQARVVPHHKDGKMHGIKLFGIRSGSLPSLLGLKNGDTIVRIGSHPLTSAEAALEVYKEVRTFDNLTVEIDRRGETILLELAAID